jgi:hypothetical protein
MTRVCPQCGTEIADDRRFCGACGGEELEVASRRRVAISCAACQHANPLDAKFCRICGASLVRASELAVTTTEQPHRLSPGPQHAPPPGRRTRGRLLISAALVAVVLAGAATAGILALSPTASHGRGRDPARSATAVGGRASRSSASAADGPPASAAPDGFHTASGNVNCSLTTTSAACSVASADMTFVLPSRGAAYETHGPTVLTGIGVLGRYGTSVSAGSIECTIPPEDVPRGVTCANTASGHGFEASRDRSRQRAYELVRRGVSRAGRNGLSRGCGSSTARDRQCQCSRVPDHKPHIVIVIATESGRLPHGQPSFGASSYTSSA